jgi:hypothetical protein
VSDPRPGRWAVRLQGLGLIVVYAIALLALIARAIVAPLSVISEPYIAMAAYLVVVVSCLGCMLAYSGERGRESS